MVDGVHLKAFGRRRALHLSFGTCGKSQCNAHRSVDRNTSHLRTSQHAASTSNSPLVEGSPHSPADPSQFAILLPPPESPRRGGRRW